ncbi:hypothetical protein [Abyssalbus ytuae]|uniref:Uncharacterized protein n=1 Tax=Abyssalbus ytuae TaxID=2926907 RepID=A0A9E7D0L8_9FLAO|nr:hypothetical protein [Abyssalbus ytuae]UOB16148.1 hypothetical protein MQE35_10405 [Abyssalbus ytuae]
MKLLEIAGLVTGSYFVVTGLGFLLSKPFYKKVIKATLNSDPVLINLSGMVHFLIGITLIALFFSFNTLLEILISFFGIAFSIKGALLIMVPELILKSNEQSIKYFHLFGYGFVAVGLITLFVII